MLTAVIFIIVIGVLVFVHELGHFVMAKKAGMKVEEFGFGFPPRLWGKKKGETIYSLNWIPFGGFVKIFGEDGGHREDKHSFGAASAGWKAIVIVAGVVMNILLAIVLLSISGSVGSRIGFADKAEAVGAKDLKIQIIQVVTGSPAQKAGLTTFDEILGYDSITDVQKFINDNKGREIELNIAKGSKISKIKIIPRVNPPVGEGALGISLALTGVVKYPIYEAVWRGITDSYYITKATFVGYGQVISKLFSTGSAGTELSGPIGIAVITGQAARQGVSYLFQFVALISINLAVLNIIPFPALDGGRLLFIIIEKIKGSPIPKKVEIIVNSVGFALLLALMVFVTTKDIIKFF